MFTFTHTTKIVMK